MSHYIQFIVKVTKHCNLRCEYCYEFASLGDTSRIAVDELPRMFTSMKQMALAGGFDFIHILWHGGEPLLLGLDFYRRVAEIEAEIFGKDIAWENGLQTNLTIVNDEILDFLADSGVFSVLSVSFDPFGKQRRDLRGRPSHDRVLENIARLLDRGIRFGVISVMTRHNVGSVGAIRDFFDRIGVGHRLLPYYIAADEAQSRDNVIPWDENVAAHRRLFDAWFTSENATPCEPLGDYVQIALAHLAGSTSNTFDKVDEVSFIVDRTGDVYGLADAYSPDHHYGNLLDEGFTYDPEGPGRLRAIEDARRRVSQICGLCPYVGACHGAHVVHAPPELRTDLDAGRCIVRETVDHAVARLEGSREMKETLSRLGTDARESLSLPQI